MLDDFEEVYAPDEDAEGKLVVAVLRQAARLVLLPIAVRERSTGTPHEPRLL